MDVGTLEMVRCDKQRMTLSVKGCARLYLSANPVAPPVWEGRHHCHGCLIGARNAGLEVSPVAGSQVALATICPRCERNASRMIGKMLCVSCYNRQLECEKGRNAKGTRPGLLDRLGTYPLVLGQPRTSTRIQVSMATSLREAMLSTARKVETLTAFSGHFRPFFVQAKMPTRFMTFEPNGLFDNLPQPGIIMRPPPPAARSQLVLPL